MVFDITDPTAPVFQQYEFNTTDMAPEGLAFIPASDSPTAAAMLLLASEDSNTLTSYSVTEASTIPAPVLPTANN